MDKFWIQQRRTRRRLEEARQLSRRLAEHTISQRHGEALATARMLEALQPGNPLWVGIQQDLLGHRPDTPAKGEAPAFPPERTTMSVPSPPPSTWSIPA